MDEDEGEEDEEVDEDDAAMLIDGSVEVSLLPVPDATGAEDDGGCGDWEGDEGLVRPLDVLGGVVALW